MIPLKKTYSEKLNFKIILLGLLFEIFSISCDPQEKIEMEVSSGLQPTITWDSGPVTRLSVMDITDESNGIDIWDIHGLNWDNRIRSPIVYGTITDTLNIVVDIAITDTTDSLITGHKYLFSVSCGPAYGSLEIIAYEE